jgi:hypothetical protein
LSEIAHTIERFDRDSNLGHAAGVMARFQRIPDDALVAAYRAASTFERFVIAGRLLPFRPPVHIDCKNMQVSLGRSYMRRRALHELNQPTEELIYVT